ncbi:MAG: hypothetical protein OXJ53_05445 [Gammaproteobacteria bacterium]|nr:hypothetical protein [Gammaproteobacteria bacterium]
MPDRRQLEAGLQRQLDALGADAPAGWKVGLTSGSARDSMGEGFRPFGHIRADRVFDSGARISLAGMRTPGIENELCFRLGRALEGEVSRSQVLDAVASVAPAFELIERRLPSSAGQDEHIADNLAQWGIVVGKERQFDWERFPFSGLSVTLHRDGEAVQQVAADGHIDDHFASIVALAVQLAAFGRRIEAGARIITGSFTKQAVAGPCRYEGDFGTGEIQGLGRVAMEYA